MKDILIVIDMQNDFINGSLGTSEAQAIVPKVKEKIKEYVKAGKKIIFTQDTHYEDYFNTLEGKMLPIPHCLYKTKGWEIESAFIDLIPQDYKNYYIIKKETFGTFCIDKYVAPEESIEIIGLCTDICVISNTLILRAQNPNSIIIVDASCCAGVTPEKHKAALEIMKSCQIEIINE